MPFEHFNQFMMVAAAGVGLVLAGGLNLALGRNGRRVWLRAVITLLVCGGVAAGLATLTKPVVAARAAGVLFGVVLASALLGSDWLSRQVAAVVSFVRRPVVRWGLVSVGGLVIVVGSGIAFDVIDERATEQSMKELELVIGRPASQPSNLARAVSDRGNPIVLKEPVSPRSESDLIAPEEKVIRELQFREQVIRRGRPTDSSNCHGWVFTGGKFLLSPEDVEQILKENGYAETNEPQAGDLVVYRQGGNIAHSAIVRYVTEGQPVLVEGKWGGMGVFLHAADKSCYGTEYTFYRSSRNGHLLVGVGGSPPAPNTPTQAAAE